MYRGSCKQRFESEASLDVGMGGYVESDEEVDTTLYQQTLERFINDFDLVAGAVLATPDGLHVASATHVNDIEADAVAAMSASMLSLADALAGQAGRAYADNLISEAESSTLVMLHAGQLILTVVGKPSVNIGMILTSARRTAHKIERLVKKDKGIVKGHEILNDPEALLAQVKKELQELRKQGVIKNVVE